MKRMFPLLATATRAMLLAGAVAAPVLATPHVNAGSGIFIEAPALKKTGAGLVLMVSLQRAQ